MAKLDLLERLAWDVATLQELLPASIQAVRERFGDCELVVRDPNTSWPRPGVRRRCGLLIRPSVELLRAIEIDCDGDQGVPGVASEVGREVLVAAEIRVGDVVVFVVSAHPPHAAADDEHEREWRVLGKLRTYAALNRWLKSRSPVVVGMDANAWIDESPFTPPTWTDTDEQAAVVRFFFEDPPAHGLRDSFRVWLAEHPQELEEIRLRRPTGPLALTYVRGGKRPVADRFDVIMVSSEFHVHAIEHNYEDAVAAGSDHAYVRTDLTVTPVDDTV
jgi:hypothetical protein